MDSCSSLVGPLLGASFIVKQRKEPIISVQSGGLWHYGGLTHWFDILLINVTTLSILMGPEEV